MYWCYESIMGAIFLLIFIVLAIKELLDWWGRHEYEKDWLKKHGPKPPKRPIDKFIEGYVMENYPDRRFADWEDVTRKMAEFRAKEMEARDGK